MNKFLKKLQNSIKRNKTLLCIGLDTDYSKIPEEIKKKSILNSIFYFNKKIIDATHSLVCSYKLNSAFYEAAGIEGIKALKKSIEYINRFNIPVIIDAKRGDIGNSSKMYAKFIFEYLNSDSTTLLPYMGIDSISPFISFKDKFSFVVIVSSNPGGKDFQYYGPKSRPLYIKIINKLKNFKNIGFVFGATNPEEIKKIRKKNINNLLLIPGIGTQGGNLKKSLKYALLNNSIGIFNVSRKIIYAGKGKNFHNDVKEMALYYSNMLKIN